MLFQLGYDEDIIELPLDLHPSLASKFNTTSEPVKVSVRPLSDVPIAEQVCFEPLSTPDWELIEMEASVLEDGGLLNQITVVYPGQIFPLRLGPLGVDDTSYSGRLESAAWIKVAEQGFVSTLAEDDSDETDSFFSSDTDSIDSKHIQVRYNYLRLMAETEVSVVPKPRTKNKEEGEEDNESSLEEIDSTAKCIQPVYGFSCPLRVQVTYLNSTETNHNRPVQDMPPFGCVHAHPSTLKQLPGYQQLFEKEISCSGIGSKLPQAIVSLRKWDGNKYNDESDHAIARISASEFVREGHITMHRCLQIQLGAISMSDWLVVQILPESCVIERVARSKELISQGKKRIQLINSSLGNPEFKSSISPTLEDDIKVIVQPTTLSNSGCIIPVSALQSIAPPGTDWLDQYCLSGYVTVKLQCATTDDRTCSDDYDYQQQSIITGTDLKRFLERKMQDQEPTPEGVSVTTISSDIIPPFDSYVEGFSSTIDRLTCDVSEIVSHSRSCGFATQRNAIMITGDVGSGKTKLALTLASGVFYSNSIGMVHLDCKKLQASPDTTLSSIMKEIQKSCQQALHKQPSLLILDDLDTLIPNSETSGGSGDGSIHHQHANPALVAQVKVIVDYLLRFSRQCKESSVVLVATCRDEDSLAAHYKDSNIFYSSVEVPSLNAHDRTRILYNYMIGEWPDGDTLSHVPNCISKLGKMTDGFRPHDLKLISTRIRNGQYLRQLEQHQTQRSRLSKGSEDANGDDFNEDSGTILRDMLESDIASVMEDFTPLSQQSVNITQNKPSVDWSLVGGLKHAKQCLYDVIIHPVRYKMIYDSSPMSLPTGVLLYGFPGSGKSFIVPALAKASNLSLITCRGPELLDRYIGASEAKVRQIFSQAITAAPCMIFFDEFDSLAPQRGSDHTGVTDRVVNQLLTLLDGAERNKKTSQIYIVAATSRPDKIDKALLRPGRLETHVYFGYPESLIEWEELFCSIVRSWDLDEEVLSLCRKGELYSALCNDLTYARDLSAADMKAVMDTAHLIRVHEMMDESGDNATVSDENGLPPKVIISKRHMITALRRTRPSLLTEDRVKLQNYYKPFGGADRKSTTPETNTQNALNHNLKTSFR